MSPQIAIVDAEKLEAGTNFGIVIRVSVKPPFVVAELVFSR